MLDNNSRNILASEKLKSDGNLCVTWLFFLREQWDLPIGRDHRKTDKVRKDYVILTIMWTNPLGPQVHVAIHEYCESENDGGPDEGGGEGE